MSTKPTKIGRMLELNEVLLAAPGISHATAMLGYVHENKYFANLAGTSTTQQRVRIQAQLTAVSVGDHGFATMRTTAPPTGRGWEYLTGTGWDFDAEVAEIPELLGRPRRRPVGRGRPLRPGDPSRPTCSSPSTSRSGTPPSWTGHWATRRRTPAPPSPPSTSSARCTTAVG